MAAGDNKTSKLISGHIKKSFRTNMADLALQTNRKNQYIEFRGHDHIVAFDAFITDMQIGVGSAATGVNNSLIGDGNIFLYNGAVTRKVGLSFKVVSSSFRNAESNLQKLSLLHLMAYPRRSKGVTSQQNTARASVLEVKFMNLVQGSNGSSGVPSKTNKGVRAHISDLNYEFDMDSGFLEDGDRINIYPKVVNVSLTFLILSENIGWESDETGRPRPNDASRNFPFGIEYNADFGVATDVEEAPTRAASRRSEVQKTTAEVASRGVANQNSVGSTNVNNEVSSNSVREFDFTDGPAEPVVVLKSRASLGDN